MGRPTRAQYPSRGPAGSRCSPLLDAPAHEPTAHLDPATADDLAGELMAATAGRTALIITHRPEQTSACPNCGSTGARPEELPRSRAHLYYVALELSKVLALVALGVAALSSVAA